MTVNLCTGGLNGYLTWKLLAPDALNLYVRLGAKHEARERAALRALRAADRKFSWSHVRGPLVGALELPGDFVLPCRNAILVSVAAAVAVDGGRAALARVLFGVTADEENADKTPEFMEAMREALAISCRPQRWTRGVRIAVETPARALRKCDLVRMYVEAGHDPSVLAATSSCSAAGRGLEHCGRCEACVKRRAAFAGAPAADATRYAA